MEFRSDITKWVSKFFSNKFCCPPKQPLNKSNLPIWMAFGAHRSKNPTGKSTPKRVFFNVLINLSCNYWSCIFNKSWSMKINFTKTEFDVLFCGSYVIVTIFWSFLFNNNNRFWFLLARDPPSCSFWRDDGSISGSHRTSSCVAFTKWCSSLSE